MIRKFTIQTTFIFVLQFLGAQNFATRHLEYLSGIMKCPLPAHSCTFHCPEICSLPLLIEYDTMGVVCHLGFSLFTDSIKNQAFTKPLYIFQERLFLEVFLQGDETKARKLLNEYKVLWTDYSMILGAGKFFNSLESSLLLASHASEYIMKKDSLTWMSSWQNDSSNFVMRFPANFDLISGMDKKEVEIWLASQLQNYQCNDGMKPSSVPGYLGELQQLNRSNYVLKGNEFFTKLINSNMYFQVLFDRNFPEESIVNLFNYPDQQRTKGLDLQIRQTAYGGESLSYKIKLFDFQCFIGDDYETYTGIEKCTEEVVEFTVIYKSKRYNYCHMLYVQTTPQSLFDKTEPLNAVFYTFIPNQNIQNLYQEYVKK